MIPFDFIYCLPATLREAAEAFRQLQSEKKNVMYYAGGSEIITMCRAGSIRPDAVIDIKNIPELNVLAAGSHGLHIGAACTLSRIQESNLFPLLGLSCGRIADHTNQCAITLGGNLCSTIIYRETSLPLLLAEAEITLSGPAGERTVPFQSVFLGQMRLFPGELVVQLHIPGWALSARHAHIKHTANEKIDYPLVTVAAIWKENKLAAAFSGLGPLVICSREVNDILNDHNKSCQTRAEAAANLLTVNDTAKASGPYRRFVLKNTLESLLEGWENGTV